MRDVIRNFNADGFSSLYLEIRGRPPAEVHSPAAAGDQGDQPERFGAAALPTGDRSACPIIEPGSWVMERKMLLIQQRAEQLAHQQTAR